MLDLAIIGGGPAALTAAIYAGRAGVKVKVFEKGAFGGVLPNIAWLENYPGYVGAGKGLADAMAEQARQAGAEVEFGECTDVTYENGRFQLTIDEERNEARAVIIASGSEPKKLSFTPEAPVSYCALCDGPLAKDGNVAVIGGANSAVQEAIFLSKIAKKVTIITHSKMKADETLMQQLDNIPNIEIIEELEPTPENLREFDYVFVYIGKKPATEFLVRLAEKYAILSRDGYVLADESNTEYPHQTVVSGLFVAGDARNGAVRQVVTAAGDGAMAAIEAVKYLGMNQGNHL